MSTATLLSAKAKTSVTEKPKRFHELDSMRGLAALVVVFHHYAHMFYPEILTGAGWKSALLFPFIAGHESVMFFFVLSGFVLSLPFIKGKSQSYPIFIWRRILRIYGPYIGALVLAVGGCALFHNRLGTTGWQAGTWFAPVNFKSVLQHVIFVGDYNYSQYNTAFWSLVYEMRISFIFPLLIFAVIRLPVRYTLLLVALCTLVGVHAGTHQILITFEYIGVFLIGALTANNADQLCMLYQRWNSGQKLLLFIASLGLYLGGEKMTSFGPLWHLGDIPTAIGAVGFIVIALNSLTAKHLLDSAVPSFLGRISYSLYLVHGTILFALTAWLGYGINRLLFFALFVPASVFLSWLFYLGVEKPFTKMSRSVGKARRASSLMLGVSG